jgi:hypothetical protein
MGWITLAMSERREKGVSQSNRSQHGSPRYADYWGRICRAERTADESGQQVKSGVEQALNEPPYYPRAASQRHMRFGRPTDKALKLAGEYYHSTFATGPTTMKPIGSLLSMVKLPIALEFFHHHLTNALGVALKPRTFNHLMSHYFAR